MSNKRAACASAQRDLKIYLQFDSYALKRELVWRLAEMPTEVRNGTPNDNDLGMDLSRLHYETAPHQAGHAVPIASIEANFVRVAQARSRQQA